ncbi:MAG: hypothetical protein DMF96_25635 [Acidobacteria bacterium]|nr:MAG: hypothetical protein DMF96_25635 [Acidobacteriota bacterium]
MDQGVTGEFDLHGNQGVNDNLLKNAGVRITWQMSPGNKLALSAETTPKWMGHHGFGAGVESSLATRTQRTSTSSGSSDSLRRASRSAAAITDAAFTV